MRKIFNKIRESLLKLFVYFWNLSKFKKILFFVALFFIVPWTLSVILFYTCYGLPSENYFSLKGHEILYKKDEIVFKGEWDENNKFVEKRLDSNFVIPKSENEISNLLVEDRKTFIYTENFCHPGFYFDLPCTMWWEENLIFSNNFIYKFGQLKWFGWLGGPFVYKEDSYANKDFLVLKMYKEAYPFSFTGHTYTYVYNNDLNMWLRVFEDNQNVKILYFQ